MQTQPKMQHTVALDIECTGYEPGNDLCFAVGVSVCRRTANYEGGKVVVSEKHQITMPLPNYVKGMTWAQLWATNKYEERCYLQFWSKNLALLDELQERANPGYKTQADVAKALQALLADIEGRYAAVGGVHYVFDTINFDPMWINWLLTANHNPSLIYHRDGEYGAKTYHVSSYIAGLLGIDVARVKDEREAARLAGFWAALEKRLPYHIDTKHDHKPENDATVIAAKFLLAPDTLTMLVGGTR
jgi:hypothetical protein